MSLCNIIKFNWIWAWRNVKTAQCNGKTEMPTKQSSAHVNTSCAQAMDGKNPLQSFLLVALCYFGDSRRTLPGAVMGLKVTRRFCISCFQLGLPKVRSGCSPGRTRALLVAAIPMWHNGDAVGGDALAYCTVKLLSRHCGRSWKTLLKVSRLPDSLDLKRSKSKDTGSSICSGPLVAGESSSHCNFFTESINKFILFEWEGVHWHGTVLEAGTCKCLQCREETGLLFSFKDKTQQDALQFAWDYISNKYAFSSVW